VVLFLCGLVLRCLAGVVLRCLAGVVLRCLAGVVLRCLAGEIWGRERCTWALRCSIRPLCGVISWRLGLVPGRRIVLGSISIVSWSSVGCSLGSTCPPHPGDIGAHVVDAIDDTHPTAARRCCSYSYLNN
jgi:hypothetical protein